MKNENHMEEVVDFDEMQAAAAALGKRQEAKKEKERPKKSDKEIEKEEIRQILDEPLSFQCPTVFGRLYGKKYRTWHIYPQTAAVLVRSNMKAIDYQVEFDMDAGGFGSTHLRKPMVDNMELMVSFLAIVVAGNGLFYKQKAWFLTKYFMRRLTMEDLVKALALTRKDEDYSDFTLSFRLTLGRRLTQPALKDEDKKG